jgi:hypothetical protein
MGLFHFGVPPWLLEWVTANTKCAVGVETGTFQGNSALLLAETFGHCTTIEKDAALAAKAVERFREDARVDVVAASSRDALPDVCRDITVPAFYWLDGHWSGGNTAGEDDPCPVMFELAAIASSPSCGASVVAVDDARLFGFGHDLDPQMQSFPRMVEVLNAIERDLSLETFIVDDVVVAVSAGLAHSFKQLAVDVTLRQHTFLAPIWADVEAAVVRRVEGAAARAAQPDPVPQGRTRGLSRIGRKRR